MSFPAKTTPQAILEAATRMLEQGGPGALSMRTLAEALGIKAPSLYRHFADRAALEAALADVAASRLRELLEGVRGQRPPETVLRGAAFAYLHFARSSTALYDQLLAPCPPGRDPLPTEAGKALWVTVLALLGDLTGNPDDTAAAVAFWSFLHGFVTLERTGQFSDTGPQGGFEVGLSALIEGFPRARPGP